MSSALSQGMIRKVNKARGKLTPRHGPPANLDMPAMTMIFRVTEPAWLDQVEPGGNIRFQVDKVNGQSVDRHSNRSCSMTHPRRYS